ncbi:MAG: hypothetical protein CVU56_21445 [Deltaproteobacteria bacterium HGW-Deltaproteobacteria-14]|nr:MAG: hypothetical protein CVU56_21445 [Deltaproteobacteria bacterium HGW-Deltaproteobacteria-14]
MNRLLPLVLTLSLVACLDPDPRGGARGPSAVLDPATGPSGLAPRAVRVPVSGRLAAARNPPLASARPTAASALCPSSGASPDDGLFVAVDGAEVTLYRADGTTRALEVWPAEPPAGALEHPGGVYLTAGPDAFVANAAWGSPVSPAGGVFTAFDADGDVLWRLTRAHGSAWVQTVAADASAVIVRHLPDTNVTALSYVSPDGVATELPGELWPLGAPFPGGHVPARAGDRAGWVTVATGAFTPVVDRPLVLSRVDGRRMVTLHEGVDAPWLVISTPAAVHVIPLPCAGGAAQQLALAGYDEAGWVVFLDEATGAFLRANLNTFEIAMFPYDAGPGLAPLSDCYQPAAAIDAAGRILAAFRDAGAAQVRRLDPETGAWTPIGPAFTAVDDLTVEVHGDHVLLRAFARGMTYCPQQEWGEVPAGVRTPAELGELHLIGPDGADALVAGDAWGMSPLSGDGLCGAVWDQDKPGTWDIVDLPTGAAAGLAFGDAPTWLR